MHRLRTRKNKKGASSEDDIPPVPSLLQTKGFFQRSKPEQVPKEPEIDLGSALPPSDDFRTSLLMPNLAQRFSILKMEQAAAAAAAAQAGSNNQYDALNLEVGGNRMDSEYNPKRFIGLGDIAETDSITGSMTSKFTSQSDERRPSEDGGSVMNRPRGGEGNVLFGGRQKVYRVPASSALRGGTTSMEDLRGGGGSLGGRTVYDHDLPDTSAARPKFRSSEQDSDGNGEHTEYNKNRFTASSTNSTPTTMTRSSTAATSINSQTGHSNVQPNSTPQSPTISTKPRRALYEQALDQQLQEQTTAMGRLERLESLRRMGTTSPPPGNESPVIGSASALVSPISPTTKQSFPWSSKRESLHSPLSPPAEDPKEQPTVTQGPMKPSGIDKFDFGLGPGSQSPISPPVSSKASEFPTQGPFTPGALSVDRGNKWGLERPGFSRSESSVSLGAVGDSQRRVSNKSNNDSMLDAPKTSTEEDLVIQQLEEELDPATRDSHHTLSPRITIPEASGTLVVSEPTSSISAASSVSAPSDKPSKSLLDAEKQFRNPSLSPTSPQFSADIHCPDDDSPTLPPGQGLSLLVRQHLRSDSGSSSMYAGSTYNRFSRLSRAGVGSVPPIPTGDVRLTMEPRASGSSAGNIWQYDEFEVASPKETPKEDTGVPGSPTSIYPPTIAPPRTPPEVPARAPERSESRGRPSEESVERGRDRSVGRPSEERSTSRSGDNDMNWEQQLAFRRQLIQQNLRNQEKINSQHDMPFPESPSGHPALAKPNGNGGAFGALRSKSSNGVPKADGKSPRIMGMDNGSAPQLPRPDSRNRSRYDGSRAFEEEQSRSRQARGPHPMQPPPPGHPMHGPPGHPMHGPPGHPMHGPPGHPMHGPPGHPMHGPPGHPMHGPPGHPMHGPPGHPMHGPPGPGQPRPQGRPRRPSLNTSQPGPVMDRALSPTGLPHPKHSPMFTPRMHQQGSREYMNGASSGENTPRGQPMGWKEAWDSPARSPRTPQTPKSQPGTPNPSKPRGGPMRPAPEGYRDDLSRAMMTGQSQMSAPRSRGRSSPEEPLPNVKSAFETEEDRPIGFRRARGNSTTAPPPSIRQKSIVEPPRGSTKQTPPPMPITIDTGANTSSTESIPTISRVDSSATSTKAPDAELIQTIQQTNAQFAPAKKRTVNKNLISEPKLLSKTSAIPTVNLPKGSMTAPVTSTPVNKNRRRTRTDTLFGAFNKNRSSDEPIPDMPTPATRSDDEVEEKPRKSLVGNRLRKSTSDGGTLGQRARAQDIAAMAESMPKFQKSMVSVPMHSQPARSPGGEGSMI